MLSDLPKVTQLLNGRGKTKTLTIHVHPVILVHSLGLKERAIVDQHFPFLNTEGDKCDHGFCLLAVSCKCHLTSWLCSPHFPDGETEVSKEEGVGPILQGVKLGRELWAFLMSGPDSWPPSSLWKVTAPSLVCETQSYPLWLEREQSHPTICIEVGNRSAHTPKRVCHL